MTSYVRGWGYLELCHLGLAEAQAAGNGVGHDIKPRLPERLPHDTALMMEWQQVKHRIVWDMAMQFQGPGGAVPRVLAWMIPTCGSAFSWMSQRAMMMDEGRAISLKAAPT